MVSLTVTRHALVLGAVDAVTGHPTLGYVDSLINMIMEPAGAQQTVTDAGIAVVAKYRGFTGEALEPGDRIEDQASVLYAVLTCLPHQVGNITDHYESTLAVLYPPPTGDTWLLEIIVMPVGYGVTVPSGVVVVAAGSSLQVTATVVGVSTVVGWIFDGADVGSANPYTVAAQTAGSSHILIAVFHRTQGIGTGAPIELRIQCIADTEILSPTVATIQGIADTEILTPTVAAIATAVTITPDVPRWFIDCAYSISGALNPTGLQVVASGATLAVTSTADTANGYVQASATPFSLDDAVFHHGTVDSAGAGSYTVPAQTDNTWHQLSGSFAIGWGCSSAVATPTGYSKIASGGTPTYTAAGAPGPGEHWHIWLDGATDLGHSPAVVPSQTNGTYHVITQVSTP